MPLCGEDPWHGVRSHRSQVHWVHAPCVPGQVVDEKLWDDKDDKEEGKEQGESKYERDAPIQVMR